MGRAGPIPGVDRDWRRTALRHLWILPRFRRSVEGFIELSGLVDVDAERPRLELAIAEVEKDLETSRRKLAKPEFRERAPATVVAKEEEKSAEFEQALERLRAQLAELG